jgi:uncharacterized lipoprotein YmbA
MKPTLRFLFCLCAIGLIAACGSKEQYYRLNASAAASSGGSSGLSVGVGPVSLPSYIDRPELVFASGPNEFQVPSDALWLGSLQENISRALAADLGQILHSRNVRGALERGFNPRYRVALEIRQFHGISGREAILDLSWKIESGASGQTVSRHSRVFQQPIAGDGYAALAEAESRLLEQCARAIAASLGAE